MVKIVGLARGWNGDLACAGVTVTLLCGAKGMATDGVPRATWDRGAATLPPTPRRASNPPAAEATDAADLEVDLRARRYTADGSFSSTRAAPLVMPTFSTTCSSAATP